MHEAFTIKFNLLFGKLGSSQRTAIMASIQTYNLFANRTNKKTQSSAIGTPILNSGIYHTEVNTLLAGSIMVTISLLIIGLCLFLHRKLKSSAGSVSLHTLPWTDENLEVYTLSGQEEITGIYLPPIPSPPPAYEMVVKDYCRKGDIQRGLTSPKALLGTYTQNVIKFVSDHEALPSYETALKLKRNDSS